MSSTGVRQFGHRAMQRSGMIFERDGNLPDNFEVHGDSPEFVFDCAGVKPRCRSTSYLSTQILPGNPPTFSTTDFTDEHGSNSAFIRAHLRNPWWKSVWRNVPP
jgi:hypothetical protein